MSQTELNILYGIMVLSITLAIVVTWWIIRNDTE